MKFDWFTFVILNVHVSVSDSNEVGPGALVGTLPNASQDLFTS